MTTGIWSKRIAAANEERGGPANGMAWVGVILVGIMGLGFQVKVRALRMFMAEAYEYVSTDYRRRVREGMEAERRRSGRSFEQERAHFHEQRQQRERWRAGFEGAPGGSTLDESRALLGVTAAANRSDLKAAYYARAKQHHPDSARATSSSESFARLKAAYDELLPHAPR